MLDKSKPFGTITGAHFAKYEQNGKFYDSQGQEVTDPAEANTGKDGGTGAGGAGAPAATKSPAKGGGKKPAKTEPDGAGGAGAAAGEEGAGSPVDDQVSKQAGG